MFSRAHLAIEMSSNRVITCKLGALKNIYIQVCLGSAICSLTNAYYKFFTFL